jgi:hypothetical protein
LTLPRDVTGELFKQHTQWKTPVHFIKKYNGPITLLENRVIDGKIACTVKMPLVIYVCGGRIFTNYVSIGCTVDGSFIHCGHSINSCMSKYTTTTATTTMTMTMMYMLLTK